MTVAEILRQFDVSGKKFENLSYTSHYRTCDEAERETLPYRAETLAFELTEGIRGDGDKYGGKFYFGPTFVKQHEAGEISEYPDRATLPQEIISYWEKRIGESQNAILRNRYAGLVWDFKEFITGAKPDFSIVRTYIQSLIDLVDGDYSVHLTFSVKRAQRAIELSIQLNQNAFLQQAKEALKNFIIRHNDDYLIGIWGAPHTIWEKYPNAYTEQEQMELIAEFERRFEALYQISVGQDEKRKRDPWLLMEIAEILARYYKSHNLKDKILPLFNKVESAFDAISGQLTNMQRVGNYTQLHQRYLKYDLRVQANALTKKIADYGKSIQGEMGVIRHEVNISKKDMDAQINAVLDEDVELSFAQFTYLYTPKRDKAKASLERRAQSTPLTFLLRQTIFDDKGRATAVVGSFDQDLEGHIILHVSMEMRFDAVFIHETIEEGKKRGIFTPANIMAYLQKTPAIKSERLSIIDRGLAAYFTDDYLVALHLWIPQIEEAIRNIIEINGASILRPYGDGTCFQLRILDDILRDPLTKQSLTSNLADYLRILLTDNRGWNLRNDICHGIANTVIFNKMTADRVLHALLCLGLFRLYEGAQIGAQDN